MPPKADMFSVEIDVCFVPLADVKSLVITIVGGNRLASTAARVRLVPRLIDLVENAAILEMSRLHFFPTAEDWIVNAHEL